ncbi:Oidioi.mRNA.OKI2018_I69.chr2.g4081.t1.cds [Oikopleura dioica]|uniref:Oidioi.mRNA.OKI2018_I69.chr2.g4081.t1.cds n=1 Tax=Oikopleura dioica TaxID=34765 RepID=A0ABN7T0G4_OIKDI|nr:Oidioi.mRNA.OKI2018_I69.chr2.g4081.t1.cds [Oikopleura dioica]
MSGSRAEYILVEDGSCQREACKEKYPRKIERKENIADEKVDESTLLSIGLCCVAEKDFKCYECSSITYNGVNTCGSIEKLEDISSCESDIGCYTKDFIYFSENYDGGYLETITKGCLTSNDQTKTGCSFYQEGDTVRDEDGAPQRIDFDHELCNLNCFNDFCNRKSFIEPDLQLSLKLSNSNKMR